MASGDVTAPVNYLKRLPLYEREKPFQLFIPLSADAPDQRTTNLEFEPQLCSFHDIRSEAQSCSLDRQGVRVLRHPTSLDLEAFRDRAQVESRYFDEVRHILRSVEGGYDKAFIFDWRLRDSTIPTPSNNELDMNDLTTWLRPSPTVHVDQSTQAVVHRIRLHLPEEAASLFKGRVRIVNVWRPIEHAVEDYPLAFCDPCSVPDRDLVECDHIRRKFKGATLYAHFNEAHRWNYLGNHSPDEVLLLKMFDSDASVPAKRLPHASFRHPTATAQSRPRRSIEVRAMLFNFPGQRAV
ncbi:methyltransferase CmcJ [Sarocladium strictum]